MDNNIIIGVHGKKEIVGGHYNVLGSFSTGLLSALQRAGINAMSVQDCVEKGLKPSLTMGFNVSGIDYWEKLMDLGIPNVMWTVDSNFSQNFEVLQKFAANPKFILFSVSASDNDPLKEFFPNVKNFYFPHATDLNL